MKAKLTQRLVSPEEIQQARTEQGGWTKEQLTAWGVGWPPSKGWRKRLEQAYKMAHKLTERDIDDYNALPLKEKLKAWDSYTRLVEAGELEPFEGLIEKPEGAE